MKKSGFVAAFATLLATLSGAHAGVLNTDYYDFEGRAFIENMQISPTCAAAGFALGNVYTVVYRFNTGTNVSFDALSFVSERSDFRVVTTQPPYSLNGSASVVWDGIDSRAGFTTGVTADSSMIITPATISATTKTIVIVGSITNFFAVNGCALVFHAALERRPN